MKRFLLLAALLTGCAKSPAIHESPFKNVGLHRHSRPDAAPVTTQKNDEAEKLATQETAKQAAKKAAKAFTLRVEQANREVKAAVQKQIDKMRAFFSDRADGAAAYVDDAMGIEFKLVIGKEVFSDVASDIGQIFDENVQRPRGRIAIFSDARTTRMC